MLETLKAFVNAWECDENDHLNVQFYFDRFADADVHYRLLAGLDEAMTGPRLVRHVRYHAECRDGALQCVRSGVIACNESGLTVLHALYEPGTSEQLSATALDHYAPPKSIDPERLQTLARAADEYERPSQPRSFTDAAPALPADPEAVLADRGFITYRGIVKPAHCSATGLLEDRHIISRMSDAASHVWETAPMTRDWLDANNCGRVAVEMRLVYGRPVRSGRPIMVISKWLGAERTTLQFRHHLFDAESGECHAIVESSGLIMDLERRKAVRLQDDFREAITAMV